MKLQSLNPLSLQLTHDFWRSSIGLRPDTFYVNIWHTGTKLFEPELDVLFEKISSDCSFFPMQWQVVCVPLLRDACLWRPQYVVDEWKYWQPAQACVRFLPLALNTLWQMNVTFELGTGMQLKCWHCRFSLILWNAVLVDEGECEDISPHQTVDMWLNTFNNSLIRLP